MSLFLILLARYMCESSGTFSIQLNSYEIYSSSTYTISLTLLSVFPISGSLKLIFPTYFTNQSEPFCTFLYPNITTHCILSNSSSSLFIYPEISSELITSSGIIISISNLTNPSPGISMQFILNAQDSSLNLIDSYLATITYVGRPLEYVNILAASLISGVITTWTLETFFDVEIPVGGYIELYMPYWNINLNPITSESFFINDPICNYACILSGNLLIVNVTAAISGAWALNITNIRNPPNTQPISGFILKSHSQLGELENSNGLNVSISTTQGGLLTDCNVALSNKKVNIMTAYTISFFTSNPLPSNSAFTLSFPNSITLQVSSIISNFGFDYSTLIYTVTSNQISIKNMLTSYKVEPCYFELLLYSCVNPSSTEPAYIKIDITSGEYISDTYSLFTIITNPGFIIINNITPANTQINAKTQYTFNFYSNEPVKNGNCIYVKYPSDIIASNQSSCLSVSQSISSSSNCTVINNEIYITNAFPNDYGTGAIQFSFDGVNNPSSTKPSGFFIIAIYSANNFLYEVSNNSSFSIFSTPGTLISAVMPKSYTTGALTDYIFWLNISDAIQINGYIEIYIPKDIFFQFPMCSDFIGFSSTPKCIFSDNQMNMTNGFINSMYKGILQFTIQGIINPKSLKPSQSFQITTYTYGFIIDNSNTGIAVTMKSLHNLAYLSSSVDSSVVGIYTFYTFNIQPFNDIPSGGSVVIYPSESITFNSFSTCLGTGTINITCTIINGILSAIVYFNTSSTNLLFSLRLGQIKNPESTKPAIFTVTTTDGTYSIDSSQTIISMLTPANFSALSISSASSYINSPTNLTINFTSANPIPENGYIQLQFSYLSPLIACYENLIQVTCTIVNNWLIITSSFNTSNSLFLENIYNPNITGNYALTLESMTNDNYIIDSSYFSVILACKPPCLTCNDSADNCLSCVSSSKYPYYWNNQCNNQCDLGYAEIGYKCEKCASPCGMCADSITACTSCIIGYLYQHSCMEKCPDTTYLQNNQCFDCNLPCKTCNSSNLCLSCQSPFSLYQSVCINNCPENITVSVSGVCTSCMNCLSCTSTPSTCTSCASNLFLYNSVCFSKCPESTYEEGNICLDCSSNCRTCTAKNVNCTSCFEGWNLSPTTSTCVSICESGYYYVNSTCLHCNISCKTCTEKLCNSCNEGYYLLEDKCVQNCGPGYFANNAICNACPDNCSECLNISTCISCSKQYFLFNSGCYSSCPRGTFEYGEVCITCNDCPLCDSSSGCLSCNEGLFFYNNTCIAECPLNYITSLNICVQCENCQTCVGQPYNCTACSNNQYLMGSTCVILCPEGYAPINNTCVVNNTGLCAPGCTESLLNNSVCDSLCNTKNCNYDNNACQTFPIPSNVSYSNTLDIQDNPFIFTSIGIISSGMLSLILIFSPVVVMNAFLPVISSLESISWLSLLVSIKGSTSFNGRVLTDTDSKITFIFGILLAIWLVHLMINTSFCVIYWIYIRKNDNLHKSWSIKHRWGIIFILCFITICSHNIVLAMFSKFPGIQVFNGNFERIERLQKPLILTQAISLVFITIPILSISGYILYIYSKGSYVYIMTLDTIAITILSAFFTVIYIFIQFCKNSMRLKKNESEKKIKIEESNATLEITEYMHSQNDVKNNQENINKLEIHSDEEETNRNNFEPSEEGKVRVSQEINYKFKVIKKTVKKNTSNLGFNTLKSNIVTDEDLICFDNYKVDSKDLRKIKVTMQNTEEQVILLKEFDPPVVIDEDGEKNSIDIDLNDYQLLSIDSLNPHIGEFQHKIYRTSLKLFRSFVGALIIDSEIDSEYKENSIDERDCYTLEKHMFDCEISDIIANDSFLSMKSIKNGFGLSSSKILLKSGTLPKLNNSEMINPHPGIEESSFENP